MTTVPHRPGKLLWPTIPDATVRRLRSTRWSPGEIRRVLALSAERDTWQAFLTATWHASRATTQAEAAETGGHCPGHQGDIADAYADGRQAAAEDARGGAAAFRLGWQAAIDRLSSELGSRYVVTRPPDIDTIRWTRHHPACQHSGGTQACAQAGCLPGPRQDFGKPAPWDKRPAARQDAA